MVAINDGVIAANKHNIVCFHESSLYDDTNEDSLYRAGEVYIGRILILKKFKK